MSLQKPPTFTDPLNFFPIIPLQRAQVPLLLDVYKMTRFVTSCYPRLQVPWPRVPSVMFSFFHPSYSSCLKGLWSQPLPGTAGCKREEEGAVRRSVPGQRPSLRSEHQALPSVTSAGKNLEARRLTELYSAVLCVRTSFLLKDWFRPRSLWAALFV